MKIAENVYAETGYTGCNIGWVETREGVTLIDTPALPPDIADLKSKINLNNIVYTIYTHEHFDHILGGGEFGKTLIAHRNVLPEIERLKTELPRDVNTFFPAVYQQYKDYIDNLKLRSPQITFTDCLHLSLGGTDIEIFHVGGHSAASVFVYLPRERVLFAGDNVNTGMPYPTPVSRFDEWIALLQKIEAMEIEKIVPGHGEICDKKAARKLLAYFESLRAQVQESIKQRKNKTDTIRDMKLDEYLPLPPDEALKPQIIYHAGVMYDNLKTAQT